MIKLKFLGRGSAFNVKEGNTSAYYKNNDVLLLIDCGESIFQKILEKKLLEGVTIINVLITHFHSDHCGSLSSLIMYCYFVKKIQVNIIYPEDSIKDFLFLTGVNTDEMCNFIKFDSHNQIHLLETKSIKYYKTSHVNEINSYSYFISFNDDNDTFTRIFYSGDTNGINEEIKISSLGENDLVYHDCCLADYEGNVHTPLRNLCELVPRESRSNVYCMHLDCEELVEKAKVEGFNVVEVE